MLKCSWNVTWNLWKVQAGLDPEASVWCCHVTGFSSVTYDENDASWLWRTSRRVCVCGIITQIPDTQQKRPADRSRVCFEEEAAWGEGRGSQTLSHFLNRPAASHPFNYLTFSHLYPFAAFSGRFTGVFLRTNVPINTADLRGGCLFLWMNAHQVVPKISQVRIIFMSAGGPGHLDTSSRCERLCLKSKLWCNPTHYNRLIMS